MPFENDDNTLPKRTLNLLLQRSVGSPKIFAVEINRFSSTRS